MIPSSCFAFLKDLRANNERPWFEANKARFVETQEHFYTFVDAILKHLALSEPAFDTFSAKKCVHRIYRDVRFSANKDPYKSYLSAGFNPKGKKSMDASYYLHLEPGRCFIGGGVYLPPSEILNPIRQEIDYNLEEFLGIIHHPDFKASFPDGIDGVSLLSRPPKGYTLDNPALPYLKMKGYVAFHAFSEQEMANSDIIKKASTCIDAIKPLISFLNRAF